MSSKSRCFSSTKALGRLNPELLSQVLKKFPEYLKARQIKLPRSPSTDNMPYADIRDACMAGDIPSELDDVLFFVCILGTRPGWDRIQAVKLGSLIRGSGQDTKNPTGSFF